MTIFNNHGDADDDNINNNNNNNNNNNDNNSNSNIIIQPGDLRQFEVKEFIEAPKRSNRIWTALVRIFSVTIYCTR